MYRVYRVYRLYAPARTYTTRFFSRARTISLTRARRVVHLEHPVHASNGNGCIGSGYLEPASRTRNRPRDRLMDGKKGNRSALARHFGVSRSTITRAVQAGRIVPEADGRFDFAACANAWAATAAGRADVAARHAKNRGAPIPDSQPGEKNATAADAGPESEPDVTPDSSRAKAKTLLMHYENSQIKLEMALRRGLRVDLAAARREAAGIGAMLRGGIERVIDMTAPRLAAASNDLERRVIVEREIRKLRWMIKRELPRGLRRMKEQWSGKSNNGGSE